MPEEPINVGHVLEALELEESGGGDDQNGEHEQKQKVRHEPAAQKEKTG